MKKIYFLLTFAAVLTACGDDYFDNNFKEDAEYGISEVMEKDYVLTAEDYTAIAGNAKNKAFADSLDQLFQSDEYSNALKAVATQHYFTNLASPDDYLPAFVQSKWPNADNGSKFSITYNMYQTENVYIEQLQSMAVYTLNEDDYDLAWAGKDRSAAALSPMTKSKLQVIMANANPDAVEDDIMMVNYVSADENPEEGTTFAWTFASVSLLTEQEDGTYAVSKKFEGAGTYILAYVDGDKCTPWGLLKTSKDTLGNFTAMSVNYPVDEDNAEDRVIEIVQATDSTYYILNNYGKYVSVQGDNTTFSLSDTIPAEGAEWQLSIAGNYSLTMYNVSAQKYVRYSTKDKYFAMYDEATIKNTPVAANTSALYKMIDGVWTALTLDFASLAIIQPADYAIFGANATSVSNPEVMLPIWLQATYPYLEVGTRMAVAYKTTKSYEATTWELTETGWIPATTYAADQIVISKERGQCTAKMSVYFNKSLLGDQGGFSVQNIALDGLSYVWANNATYGWKASGYYKTNHTSESWLVSPAFNFKNAVAPYMTFDHVYKYLATGDAAEFNQRLGVFVSTDYAGDVTTCTWTQIELTADALPTNQDWVFVNCGNLDLTPFIGGKCWVGFRYTSSNDVDGYTASATWEVKNLLIREPED